MKDIYLENGKQDLQIAETVVFKAKNLIETQEGSIYYHDNFGIDLERFLDPDIQIQNRTFEAYSLQKMGEWGINPLELVTNQETYRQVFNYTLDDATKGGLIK